MWSFEEYAKTKNLNKKLIDQYGKYKVYSVNGEALRDRSPEAEEFGGSSIHAYLSLIPEDEIWIEDEIKPAEQKILIQSALYQLKCIERGESCEKAYKSGIAKEKDYRESLVSSNRKPWKVDRPASKDVYVKLYGCIESENIDVMLVDGAKVRNCYKADFIEGGHGYVYSWVPNKEIWIEQGPHTDTEAPFLLLHEFVERTLMKEKKMAYDLAHRIAAKVEFSKRPDSFNRKDALTLTPQKALELASHFD